MSKVISKLKNSLGILNNFGIKYAIDDVLESFIFRKKTKLGKIAHQQKYKHAKEYLRKKYGYIIDEYKDIKFDNNFIEEDSTIFVFWWQGEKNAPLIVKLCLESIKKNAVNHNVCVIDKFNYDKYVNIPEYIINKVENGIITLTHFSDILRVSLLYEYGGFWLDATLFLTQNISEDILKYNFYTIRHNNFSDFHVCKGKWSGNFLVSTPKNILMKYIRDFLFEYWKNENMLICYLLIDCCMALGYENIDNIKSTIDKVPINNTETFELEKAFLFNYKITPKTDTYIYKLSFKRKFPMYDKKGKPTTYNEFLNGGNIFI